MPVLAQLIIVREVRVLDRRVIVLVSMAAQ
jgi:hypothetical protein